MRNSSLGFGFAAKHLAEDVATRAVTMIQLQDAADIEVLEAIRRLRNRALAREH